MGVLSTGCAGLDVVLRGGLPRGALYIVEGEPGAGKTTLGLQFLLEGARHKERGLYLPLSETRRETDVIAASHGWSLKGIEIHELAGRDRQEDESTLFHPAEVEFDQMIEEILAVTERAKPSRIVFDSLSELRMLATNPLRYRRQLLSLKRLFADRDYTVLMLDDLSGLKADSSSLAHGVIELTQTVPAYGRDRRRVRVVKVRGVAFQEGLHDLQIVKGGLVVHPRLDLGSRPDDVPEREMSSGLPNLDDMLGGGLSSGSTALFVGPAGTGKSSLALQYVFAAAGRGEKSILLNFDETASTTLRRAKALGKNLGKLVKNGTIALHEIDPSELPPGELVTMVRSAVEHDGVKFVVLDSLNGYMQSMPEEKFMLQHLHDLLSYLRHRGVIAILVVAQHGLLGTMRAPLDISYIADTVVVFRYFEHRGRIRKALSVLKKRTSGHESSIRELTMSTAGMHVGAQLDDFDGVLSGIPREHNSNGTAGAPQPV